MITSPGLHLQDIPLHPSGNKDDLLASSFHLEVWSFITRSDHLFIVSAPRPSSTLAFPIFNQSHIQTTLFLIYFFSHLWAKPLWEPEQILALADPKQNKQTLNTYPEDKGSSVLYRTPSFTHIDSFKLQPFDWGTRLLPSDSCCHFCAACMWLLLGTKKIHCHGNNTKYSGERQACLQIFNVHELYFPSDSAPTCVVLGA